MNRLVLLLLCFLFFAPHSRAQQAGCFKPGADGQLVFTTDIDFSGNDVFFLGEFHGVYGVPGIKLALLEHLAAHYGITDVFMEIGHSSAWLYNEYLRTGDTALFSSPAIAYSQKQPDRDFWKNLYAYNLTLNHSITIHGMDFERMEFLKVLKLLMPPGKEKPQPIAAMLTYIDTVSIPTANADIHDKDEPGHIFNALYDSIRRNIEQNKQLYSQYYGAGYKVVEQIMFNENTFAKYANRNAAMYHNIIKAAQEQGIRKFIVFAGLNHADMSYAATQSLCNRLSETPAYKHKLTSIAMVCKNCYDWELAPAYRQAAYRAPATYVSDTTLVSNIFKRFYNSGCSYTMLPSAAVNDSRVSNCSQYIILLKDQRRF